MLHEGAKTRFILCFLTDTIDVNFSIRQGDPLAMLLYIIYVEPLLIVLEKSLTGLRLPNVQEVLESYCDDLNVMTDDPDDFLKLSSTVDQFEKVSGVILSRDRKCKVLGLGKWAGREQWPLDWLRTVKSVKVFGIFISNNYREIISLNWNFRLEKFRRTIMSWSSRRLDTLQQRIEVLRSFALSRVYYVASILPLRQSLVKQFETLIGKFLWKGRILRVALEELKNGYLDGGLNLPCIGTMNRSLLASQCLRLINSGDQKSIAHLDYWMGPVLEEIFADFGHAASAVETPDYFLFIGECIAEIRMSDLLSTDTADKLSNRKIYEDLAHFPTPKVAEGSTVNYKRIWKRLRLGHILTLEEQDCLYLLINNKLSVPERLYRIGMRDTFDCSFCTGNICSDLVHFFCGCIRIRDIWCWLRSKIDNMASSQHCSDWEMLNLAFPQTRKEKTVVWMIGVYVGYIWQRSTEGDIDFGKFFGFLSFKYKETGSNVIGHIDALAV